VTKKGDDRSGVVLGIKYGDAHRRNVRMIDGVDLTWSDRKVLVSTEVHIFRAELVGDEKISTW
jgi:hypothetical protein